MIEIWKDIPEYNGKYQASTEGEVRRIYKDGTFKLMTPFRKKMKGRQRLLVKLTINKKSKDEILIQLIAKTFLGSCPEGYVAYHINGCQLDNYVNNIAYISKKELGCLTGAKSRRQPVAKIDSNGEIVEVYSSAREAARNNYMSYQTIIDRCNRKCKSAFAPDGYAYAWDDKEVSIGNAIRKIELENGYMEKAPQVEFEW